MELNKYIDYTCIKPHIRSKEVKRFVKTGIDMGYRALVLHHQYLTIAYTLRQRLNSDIKIAVTWGFPWDNYTLDILDYTDLCDEIDVVLPDAYKEFHIVGGVVDNLKKSFPGKTHKVIIETETCSTDRKKRKQEFKDRIKDAERKGADIIKTNTGLIKRNPFEFTLVDDIKVIKKLTRKPIKASGGIKTRAQCEELIDLGVSIIGTSSKIE